MFGPITVATCLAIGGLFVNQANIPIHEKLLTILKIDDFLSKLYISSIVFLEICCITERCFVK